jgi:hypothetical protein
MQHASRLMRRLDLELRRDDFPQGFGSNRALHHEIVEGDKPDHAPVIGDGDASDTMLLH